MFLGLNKRARRRSSCRKQAAAAATVAKLIKKFDYQDFNLHFFSLSPTPSPSENGRFGVYHRGQNRYHDST